MSLPIAINAVRVPDDYLSPLHGVAHVVLPDHDAVMKRDELLATTREHQAMGILIAGETQIDAAFLDSAPSLKIVANVAAGFNNLAVEAMAKCGVWATNTPDAFVDATADATFGLLLAVARKTVLGDRYVRSGEWARSGICTENWEGMELRGKTLGIVGFGKIGQAVAKRAEAFGMRVIHTRRNPDESAEFRTFEALLAEADVISLHTPLSEQTRHMIDAAAFAAMKPGAVLLNLARGPVVDEAALLAALQSGKLAGAGLDVYENEPDVPAALCAMDNVALTPHLGGATREARKAARLTAAENVRRVILGERPLTPLNEPTPG